MSLDFTLTMPDGDEVFDRNMTHNLTSMASFADCYKCLWHPEELKLTKACQLTPFLERALLRLVRNKRKAEEFNPENGWGNYENLLSFVVDLTAAAYQYPDAKISVSV